jgi:hypothetical protein
MQEILARHPTISPLKRPRRSFSIGVAHRLAALTDSSRMIKFLCPSGHPLNAPENLAGKSGKCPKCNLSFLVPQPNEAAADGNTVAASGSALTPAMGSGKNLSAGGEIFVFLCPNGHKLNGPPSMKGKPGQCPHCGARFLIPTDDDLDTPEDEQSPDERYHSDTQTSSGTRSVDFSRLLNAGTGEQRQGHAPPAGPAGLGYIVGRLWESRIADSELEVFLNEGEIIAPDYFSESLSTSDYGVFAIQEGDGTYAITAIPWSTVRRVGLRRLTELPAELFE